MSEILSKLFIGIHTKYPLLSDLNAFYIFSTDFRKKYSNIKFHENPSSGSRAVPCRRKDGTQDEAYSRFSQFSLDFGGTGLTQSDVRLASAQRRTLICIRVCFFVTNKGKTFIGNSCSIESVIFYTPYIVLTS